MTYEIRQLDHTLNQRAFELVTEVFVEASTLHRALKAGLGEYREFLRPSFKAMVSEGLSVAAVHKSSNKLAGCMIVTDFHNQSTQTLNTHPIFSPMSALTVELCKQYSQKRLTRAGQAILVDMGAVSKDARNAGVYQEMRSVVHETAAKRGFQRVIGELSSIATQNVVLQKLGHRKMAEVDFETFKFKGRYPFQKIEEPASIILAEGDL